jgi:glyoxylase-like metal-dependent hydrolase (beta-lactamase superfamily II)
MHCRSIVLLSCLAAGAALGASQQPVTPLNPEVKAGTTIKVAAHTYVIPDNNVPLVPNVGIVVGSRATLVIDPGLGTKNGETVAREVAEVSRNAEVFVAATHFHVEHTTGAMAFPAAKYVASRIQQEEFAASGPQQIQSFSARSAETADFLKGAGMPEASIAFDRSYALDLGGVHVHLMVVGPTHTKGDTGFFVQEDGVLFSGDVVMNDSFLAANASSSVQAWLAAFDTFEALRPKVVVPSHGMVGDGALVAANRALVTEIRTRTLALKAQGRSSNEAAAAVHDALVAEHRSWARATGIGALAASAYAEAQ